MKRKFVKRNAGRFLSVLLVATMLLSIAGCGEKSETAATVMDKNHVYSYEEISLPVELDDIRGIFCRNDRIYYVGIKYEETTNTYLCSTALDGSDGQSVKLQTGFEVEMPENSGEDVVVEEPVEDYGSGSNVNIWINSIAMDVRANLFANVEINKDYMDERGEYVSESRIYLFCWNSVGEVLCNVDLSAGLTEDEYFYVNSMFCDKDGLVWIYGNNKLMAYDIQGNLVKNTTFTEEINGSMYQTREGEIFVLGWKPDGDKQYMKKIDKNTLALGPEEEYPEVFYNYGIQMEGERCDFILTDGNSVYTYNLGDEAPVEIMNTIDSDLSCNGVYNICMISDTEFIGVYNNIVDWTNKTARFTKVPPEQVKDKITLQLAGMYIDSDVKSKVVDFNKYNDTYRIQLKEYRMYSTSEDYMAGYTQLNNDIIAGKMPDILLVDSSMPFDSYIAKGLIADLNPLLDEDPELQREDFLENILDAYSVDGKLYQLVPGFEVTAIVAKTSIVGDRTGWNMQEFRDVMATLPEGTQSFSDMSRYSMLYLGLMMTRDEYINKETGECSFDSQGFIDFLNFVKEFPEEIDYSVYDDDNYWAQQESAFREDRTILTNRYFYSYNDFNRLEKGEFGEEVTLIGFPTENRNGNAIVANMSLALSAKSANLDGAWQFVRDYLTDEYQSEMQYQFPIRKDALAILEKEAQERPYWENEDGEKEYYDDTYYINGVEIPIDPMTAERAAEFTDFLSSVSLVGSYDESMMNIINEEAEAFFAGQKSAEEVAGIIQSRMKIYISENR